MIYFSLDVQRHRNISPTLKDTSEGTNEMYETGTDARR